MNYKNTKVGPKLYMGKWDTAEFEHAYDLLRYAQKQMEKHKCYWVEENHGDFREVSILDIEKALEVLDIFKKNHSVNLD